MPTAPKKGRHHKRRSNQAATRGQAPPPRRLRAAGSMRTMNDGFHGDSDATQAFFKSFLYQGFLATWSAP